MTAPAGCNSIAVSLSVDVERASPPTSKSLLGDFSGHDTISDVNARVWLAIWSGLIVVVVVPWGTFEPHAHWERMAWIPFISPPVDLGDVIGNLFFYVPYGILVGLEAAETRGAILLATGSAAVLSLATEFTQIFSASRFPSMTDVACNVIGACIGASWVMHRRARITAPLSNDFRRPP